MFNILGFIFSFKIIELFVSSKIFAVSNSDLVFNNKFEIIGISFNSDSKEHGRLLSAE